MPTLFYSAPPGDLPIVLAVGHEFQLGSEGGPPLAFWLAELAFNLAGRNLFGVYVLSQICVVVTYWAIFLLGRRRGRLARGRRLTIGGVCSGRPF